VVPHYGGGMGTCKAALQMDAKQLAWFVGDKDIRVNLISAGPYASRAARAINKDFDKLVHARGRPLAAASRRSSRRRSPTRRSTCAARWPAP
jgi:enoyl-[acyl-carrier-protein] reductase (NADH)